MAEISPIFCAIDTPELAQARTLAQAVRSTVNLKLGLEFFVAHGPAGVREVAGKAPLFLDLKLHDSPNIVASAVRAADVLRPMLLSVHCSGGPKMMRAAAEAAKATASRQRTKIVGIAVLEGLSDADLSAIGQHGSVHDQIARLAALARDCGLDGLVCPPLEIPALRAVCGLDFLLIVPGVRVVGFSGGQRQTISGRELLNSGANYLLVGRQITAAPDPAAAARALIAALR